MTTKVISFLGTSVKPTTYSYQNQRYEGSLFQIALRQFIEFDEMAVFVTPQASKKAYPTLAALNDDRIKPVQIRQGKTSEGLWEIFNKLVENVAENDAVIFDITHGLRSIPFLTFLAAAYLCQARNITLKAVFYGAYDLGQPAPVIDLTEFVSLLDWLTATNQFITTGNASALAKELHKTERPALRSLTETVEDIATGLHLLRPNEVNKAAASLSEILPPLRQELPPPFALLAGNLLEGYGRFGHTGPTSPETTLSYQLDMVNWYQERGQIVHALSLAREWIVSFLCIHFNLDPENRIDRKEMEFLVGGGKQKNSETGEVVQISDYLSQWDSVPEGKRLRRLWGSPYQLANLRNDVLHSGFRRNAKSSAEVKQAAAIVLEELNAIAAELGIKPVGGAA